MKLEPGQKVGDYEILARLGVGGLGVVYEVQHVISQRREAIKILLPDQSGPEMVERFHREVQTLAALNHINIAALHNAFYCGNQLAMVMELVKGETLRVRRQRLSMTLAEVLDVASQTLRALVYAHGLGVVHRDIKPSNIMLTPEGVVKLLDFGIARTEKSSDLTNAGHLVGSLSYMSPEQIRGEKASPRSDIYALGVTLYELLSGRMPVTGSTNYEIMMGHMERVPAPLYELLPTAPLPLSNAVMRALEKDPAHRFQTAEEFLQAVQHLSTGATLNTSPSLLTTVMNAPPISTGSGASASTAKPASGSGFPSLELEQVSRKLAVYIGPVAKIVVKKLAAQHTEIDVIYREAAKQISSEADRAAFLRSKLK